MLMVQLQLPTLQHAARQEHKPANDLLWALKAASTAALPFTWVHNITSQHTCQA
jgi:hypothetical protein